MKKRTEPKSGGARAAGPSKPDLQGEGNYEAARRYREGVEHHVETADIEGEARQAAPRDAREAADMAAAEAEGRRHAKRPSRAGKPRS